MAPLKENNKSKVIRSKLLVATTLLIATIWVAANFLDLSGMVAALASLPAQTAVLVFSLGATSWVLRGLRTWMLFGQLSLREALGMSFIHNTANNLAPMRLGELALPVLARWLGNVEFSVGLTSLLWVRFLDLISLIGVSICIVFLPTVGAIMLALLAAFVFLVPLLIAIVIPKTQQIRLPQILEQARDQLIYEAQAGTRLHRLWRLTILAWLSKILGMCVLLATLSGIPMADVTTTILGAELSSILPIHGLAGAGSYEAGGVIGSALTGVPPIIALEMTIQLHIYVLSLTAVFGILGCSLLLKRTLNG